MTQSGQGDEQLPAVRPAHEGVVLPAEGGAPWSEGGRTADRAAPAGGQPWGGPWGPDAHQDGRAPGQLPPEQHQPDAYGQYRPQQPYASQQDPQQSYASPHDPQQQSYAPPQQQYGSPQDAYQQDPYQQQGPQQSYAQPLPPEAVPGMPGGGDADATQYIAPVPGGLPPTHPAESTQYLGQSGQGADADATQYIPPVPGGAPYGIRPGPPGERQPPAEFDSLFRDEGPAGATQQMPQVGPAHQQPPHQQPPRRQHQPPQGAQPSPSGPQGVRNTQEPGHGGGGAPRRRSAHIPLIAAVVIGCAVIGLGAGALMSGGDEKSGDDKQSVSAQSSPAGEASAPAAADPAEPQAQGLDKLLADSNDSRATVISAVGRIESCQALDQAATDLRGAATQRRDLVTRLEGLSIDQLPAHAELKSALTAAWQASAQADDHYAAWADQARNNKKVCKGGKARSTDEKGKANAASGVATREKQKASGLWNSIAEKYGLTKHTPTDL
ncbi:hypothetical protein EES45_14790 [Streptomyces sp. ADI97-07]|uniref:hypothetical protein n=1 Tax=Streptomyces sp. ADI97-07 TaxID=1522762 RepID=UPI000FA0C9D0|nr:hypothetical protein [Streptomyces sp. ADI97-07]RPK79736.1 hypothetical protein EES45_14790 [Streptomyces sp. ADI97-07]